MPIRRTDTERRRRRAFLHALGAGRTIREAADHAGVAWSTLYSWRDKSAAFDAAWTRAAERAQGALADRLRAALIERAVEGVDEPVFHAGERIGTRKRYSDALLIAGLSKLAPEPPPTPARIAAPPAEPPGRQKRVTVVIAPYEDAEESEPLPPVAARPALTLSAPSPPEADPDKPLRWDHL